MNFEPMSEKKKCGKKRENFKIFVYCFLINVVNKSNKNFKRILNAKLKK